MELVSAGFGYSHTYNEQRWGNVKKGYCHFQNGDIGIAKISPCFENRKSTIFYDLPNGFGAGTTELVILRGHIVCSEFYLNLFQSSWYISEGTKYFKGNVGQQRVKKDIFTTLLIPLPPLEEQKRIVKALQMWFAAADELELSKTDLQDIIKLTKTRVLGLAIHGKLVPQDPSDEPAIELLKRMNPDFVPWDTSHYEKNSFKIPEGWIWVCLEQVADIARGGSPRPIKSYLTNDENGINWIKIGDAEKGEKYINHCEQRIKPEGVKSSRFVHRGDFLLTNSMSYGRPYILNIEGCIHDGWLVISPKDGIYDKEFLYYLLSSDFAYKKFSGQASGTTVSNLNIDRVASALFPIAPLEEQRRIVMKIEEAFSYIDAITAEL